MKILCLGNGDNIGVRLYSWLREYRQNVTLYRIQADEDRLRGNPYLYLEKNDIENNPHVVLISDDLLAIRNIALFGGKLIDEINKNYDFVIITGGWHALIYSRKIKKPKLFIYVGYELHTKAKEYRGLPSVKEIRQSVWITLRNYFYGCLTRSSFQKVDKYLDWFPAGLAVTQSLGLLNKVIYMAIGEDISRNKKLMDNSLSEQLNKEAINFKKTFLFLSRLNFSDPSKANCKSADLFLKGLESQIINLEKKFIKVYIGDHGEEAEQFKAMAKNSSVYRYITWVSHLDYGCLMSYLSIKNAVLFTDFGDVNSGISGIGRDGYAMGIPMVNSTTEDTMIKQYTTPGPRIYVKTKEDVEKAMNDIMNLSEEEFLTWKQETLEYGKRYVDKDFFIKRLLIEIKKIVHENTYHW